MASLCGLKAGHIWSNYLTRKQLSVILKGEGFQLINLLNPQVLLPFQQPALVSLVVKRSFVGRGGHCMFWLQRSFAQLFERSFKDFTASNKCSE